MLIRFGCENYRSVSDYQEVLLTSISKKSEDNKLLIEHEAIREKLLPILSIYGANASGKTNFIRALRCMWSAIVHSTESSFDFRHATFKLTEERDIYPSVFDVDFICDNVHYHYGYSVINKTVAKEWLYSFSYNLRMSRKVLFTRDAKSDEYYFSKDFQGKNKSISSVTSNKTLFLAQAAKSGHELLSKIQDYFKEKYFFRFEQNNSENTLGELILEKDLQKDMSKFLSLIDAGVDCIEVKQVEPDSRQKKMLDSLIKAVQEVTGREDLTYPDRDVDHRITLYRKDIFGNKHSFSYDEESLGTRSLMSILGPILFVLREGGVIIIDELESSLHSLLSQKVVELFNNKDINKKNAQIIFTTHETQLLNFNGVSKDEVWLTEKSDAGSTVIWPLTEYSIDKRVNLKNGYLDGRFGGIPLLGALNSFKLFED